MIATLAARYMHWFEYCLYPHEMVNDGCNKGHIIVSGTRDHLIPFKGIECSVEDANKLCKDDTPNDKEIGLNDYLQSPSECGERQPMITLK